MEEDGFLSITDRLSRFSKIGGEMVPHIHIEEKLQELFEETEQVFAVTSVTDEKKGERIVVVHTLDQDALGKTMERLANVTCRPCGSPRPTNSCASTRSHGWERGRYRQKSIKFLFQLECFFIARKSKLSHLNFRLNAGAIDI